MFGDPKYRCSLRTTQSSFPLSWAVIVCSRWIVRYIRTSLDQIHGVHSQNCWPRRDLRCVGEELVTAFYPLFCLTRPTEWGRDRGQGRTLLWDTFSFLPSSNDLREDEKSWVVVDNISYPIFTVFLSTTLFKWENGNSGLPLSSWYIK